MNTTKTPPGASSATMASVFAGRQCVGFVFDRGVAGTEAFTVFGPADDNSLGLFKTRRAAANAVLYAANPDGPNKLGVVA